MKKTLKAGFRSLGEYEMKKNHRNSYFDKHHNWRYTDSFNTQSKTGKHLLFTSYTSMHTFLYINFSIS